MPFYPTRSHNCHPHNRHKRMGRVLITRVTTPSSHRCLPNLTTALTFVVLTLPPPQQSTVCGDLCSVERDQYYLSGLHYKRTKTDIWTWRQLVSTVTNGYRSLWHVFIITPPLQIFQLISPLFTMIRFKGTMLHCLLWNWLDGSSYIFTQMSQSFTQY